MTRVVRNAALLCVGGILVASAALANVPDPTKCTLGSNYSNTDNKRLYIPVTGFRADSTADSPGAAETGTLEMKADWEVFVKDNTGTPIQNATVCIDFSGCADMQLSANQLVTKSPAYVTSSALPNGSVQQLVGCNTVCGATNASGKYMFKVIGRARNTGAPGAYPTGGGVKSEPLQQVSYEGDARLWASKTANGCARVTANLQALVYETPNLFNGGTGLTDPKAWLTDVAGLDAAGLTNQGVDGTDLSQLIHEKNNEGANVIPKSRARSDYSRDGLVDGTDVSRMINFVTVASVSGALKTANRVTGTCP